MSPRPLALAALLAAACTPPAEPASVPAPSASSAIPASIAADAARGVATPALRDLLARQWDRYLREDPVWATKYGDHRFDALIEDNSSTHLREQRLAGDAFLAEARKITPATPADRVTLALFIESIDADLASAPCAFETWNVGAYSENPLSHWNTLPDDHHVDTLTDARNLLARYLQIPAWIDRSIANLREGARAGRFASAVAAARVLAMVDKQLATPFADWVLEGPAKADHLAFPAADLAAFRKDLEAAITGPIRAALERYRAVLAGEILPHARDDEHAGVRFVPSGAECYRSQIRAHTTLPLSAAELHAVGEAEIARDDTEMQRLGEELFGLHELPEILKKLRGDPALYFTTEAEVEEKAQRSLAAAKAKIHAYFGLLPKTDCVVHRIPDVEAPFTTIAYYREPNPDGSKPGELMINVSAPTTRPRYEAQALAFHEGIPGHHLQIALAQEMPASPAFRRFFDPTAFAEGWALYAERVADEMGLYDGDLDRLGLRSFDAWRAARLVVDTGIHELGWSRAQAIAYMLAHTALAPNNIENEVDRYIYWPGQALGYKTGQLAILKLRKKAEAALGKGFELRAFHDAVLGGGAVTLPILEERIDAWITSTQATPPPSGLPGVGVRGDRR